MDKKTRDDVLSKIFSGTGRSYDRIVDLATRGEDRHWKDALLAEVAGSPRRVLDLACGTGILAFLISDRFPSAEVVGVDISEPYLAIARGRALQRGDDRVRFLLCAAEELDTPGPFDLVTSCYLPKYADLPRLIPGLAAMLPPGGLLVMQDFTYPAHPAVRGVWQRHFARMKEWARLECPEAQGMFETLPEVIRLSRWVEELPAILAACDLVDVRVERQSWGTSAIVSGKKP